MGEYKRHRGEKKKKEIFEKKLNRFNGIYIYIYLII